MPCSGPMILPLLRHCIAVCQETRLFYLLVATVFSWYKGVIKDRVVARLSLGIHFRQLSCFDIKRISVNCIDNFLRESLYSINRKRGARTGLIKKPDAGGRCSINYSIPERANLHEHSYYNIEEKNFLIYQRSRSPRKSIYI